MEAVYISRLRRPNHVGCRLSDEENRLVMAAARRDNVPVADWFRRAILAAVDKGNEPSNGVLLAQINELQRMAQAVPDRNAEPSNQTIIELMCLMMRMTSFSFEHLSSGKKFTKEEMQNILEKSKRLRLIDADSVINEAVARNSQQKKSGL